MQKLNFLIISVKLGACHLAQAMGISWTFMEILMLPMKVIIKLIQSHIQIPFNYNLKTKGRSFSHFSYSARCQIGIKCPI